MLAPNIPANERLRLDALHALHQLDTGRDPRFDRITRLAGRLLGMPIAMISLVDAERQWFKSCLGHDLQETARDISFCAHAILGDEIFEVEDAMEDERFRDNPLVTQAPHIRFYAGAPLQSIDGYKIGTLCVVDHQPRKLSEDDRQLLRSLADWAQFEFSMPVVNETLDKVLIQDAKLSAILNTAVDAIMTINERGLISSMNPAAEKMFGYTPEEVIGQNVRILMPEPFSSEHDAYLQRYIETREARVIGKGREGIGKRKNGTTFPLELAVSETVVANERFFTGILRDITDRKAAESMILQMAQTDPLTGLPNRALFSDRFRQALANARRGSHGLALIYIDLDNFKPINDNFGHAVGDTLLRLSTFRMQNCLRESDTLARVGGDEFVIVLSQVETHENATRVARKILEAMNEPFELNGQFVKISCSCGIAIYPDHGMDEVVLTKHADNAMYLAKKSGRNRFVMANTSTTYTVNRCEIPPQAPFERI